MKLNDLPGFVGSNLELTFSSAIFEPSCKFTSIEEPDL